MSTVNAIGNFVWASDSNKNQKERQEQYLELMYMHQQYNGIIIKQNYVPRESKLSCSFGSNYSLLDIGQDHGIYKGNLPLMTTIDSGKNNIYHFGSCLCPESNYAGRLPMTAETHQDGKKAKKAINNKYAHICVPMVPEGSAWKQVDHSIMAKTCAKGYVPVLVDNAVLVCQYGGLITVVEVPQMGTTKGSAYIITSKMMSDFGWNISNNELKLLNDTIQKYGITNANSVRLFMATCAHESGKGKVVLEKLKANGTTVGNYVSTERGAGYIQLTWRATHLKFLATIPDTFAGTDTATYISQNYPWQAAAWFWTSKDAKTIGTSPSLTINEYVEQYGDSLGVYLLTQYAVNGWVGSPSNTILSDIREGIISWTVANGRVLVKGVDVGRSPNGWNDTQNNYNRESTYNEAIMHFQ